MQILPAIVLNVACLFPHYPGAPHHRHPGADRDPFHTPYTLAARGQDTIQKYPRLRGDIFAKNQTDPVSHALRLLVRDKLV